MDRPAHRLESSVTVRTWAWIQCNFIVMNWPEQCDCYIKKVTTEKKNMSQFQHKSADHTLNWPKTPHQLPSNAIGVVSILQKTDNIITVTQYFIMDMSHKHDLKIDFKYVHTVKTHCNMSPYNIISKTADFFRIYAYKVKSFSTCIAPP